VREGRVRAGDLLLPRAGENELSLRASGRAPRPGASVPLVLDIPFPFRTPKVAYLALLGTPFPSLHNLS
jgi:hypothetical protein